MNCNVDNIVEASKLFEHHFNVNYYLISMYDENDVELNFDGYERIKLTNPLFGSDISFSERNFEFYFRRTHHYIKNCLTSKNILNYRISQEIDLDKTDNKDLVYNTTITLYSKDKSIYSEKMLEYFKTNRNIIVKVLGPSNEILFHDPVDRYLNFSNTKNESNEEITILELNISTAVPRAKFLRHMKDLY